MYKENKNAHMSFLSIVLSYTPPDISEMFFSHQIFRLTKILSQFSVWNQFETSDLYEWYSDFWYFTHILQVEVNVSHEEIGVKNVIVNSIRYKITLRNTIN